MSTEPYFPARRPASGMAIYEGSSGSQVDQFRAPSAWFIQPEPGRNRIGVVVDLLV
jgi:hypothetical protein